MYDIIHMMIEYEFEYTFIIQGRWFVFDSSFFFYVVQRTYTHSFAHSLAHIVFLNITLVLILFKSIRLYTAHLYGSIYYLDVEVVC